MSGFRWILNKCGGHLTCKFPHLGKHSELTNNDNLKVPPFQFCHYISKILGFTSCASFKIIDSVIILLNPDTGSVYFLDKC